MNTPLLSVIIPVFNESAILEELVARTCQAVEQRIPHGQYELILVNDGSKDNSVQILAALAAKTPGMGFISFSRNFGHQIAVTAGLDHCRGQAVVIMDGDLQDPPELIPALYDAYRGGFDVVYAQRRSRQGESAFKKFTAALFYRLLRRITQIEIPLDTGDFRLIDAKVVQALRNMPEQNKFYRGQIAWLGFKSTGVLFDRHERAAGSTGYTLKKMIKFALDGITAFSDTPLRVATRLGFVFSGAAFVVILYALISHFAFNRTITGWTSLIISSAFFGGIQLLCLGILGEYISRMNRNIQNRPLYIAERVVLPSEQASGH
jgi:dolichol-phosphate mannosyltransferase